MLTTFQIIQYSYIGALMVIYAIAWYFMIKEKKQKNRRKKDDDWSGAAALEAMGGLRM
jgi:heme/copper-type cytochrome/quinol oxidase subunit 2